jgi:NIPSNAP
MYEGPRSLNVLMVNSYDSGLFCQAPRPRNEEVFVFVTFRVIWWIGLNSPKRDPLKHTKQYEFFSGTSVPKKVAGQYIDWRGQARLITCFIRYTIDPTRLADFEHYARTWMRLIEKYGGTHHGYFVPDSSPPSASFSFAGLGETGPANIGLALFSFPSLEDYEKYRRDVADDPECHAATLRFEETRCFTKYERTFMKPVTRG